MNHLLDVRNIHAWYGSSHVLHGIDLSVQASETIGLLVEMGWAKVLLFELF